MIECVRVTKILFSFQNFDVHIKIKGAFWVVSGYLNQTSSSTLIPKCQQSVSIRLSHLRNTIYKVLIKLIVERINPLFQSWFLLSIKLCSRKKRLDPLLFKNLYTLLIQKSILIPNQQQVEVNGKICKTKSVIALFNSSTWPIIVLFVPLHQIRLLLKNKGIKPRIGW